MLIYIPHSLTRFTEHKTQLETKSETLQQIFDYLAQIYPILHHQLFTNTGNISPYITIYLNKDDVRHLNFHKTKISPDDIITIVCAVAGG